jgi:hypothetical protein
MVDAADTDEFLRGDFLLYRPLFGKQAADEYGRVLVTLPIGLVLFGDVDVGGRRRLPFLVPCMMPGDMEVTLRVPEQ